MNIYFSRPYALFALLLLAIALLYRCAGFRRLKALPFMASADDDCGTAFFIFRLRRFIGMLCTASAWICLVFAWSGPEWGMFSVPVRTSGGAISFVFDVSYSMTAQDMPGSPPKTRLDAAALCAENILEKIGDCPVSVVLAKGSGVIAVPMTEDKNAVLSLMRNLSPAMMSSVGSDIGSGVAAAIRSFPSQTAKKASIIVFTDGEETAGSLEKAIEEAVRCGISVIIAETGTEAGAAAAAGGGETEVHTSLQKNKLHRIAEKYAAAEKKAKFPIAENERVPVLCIDAAVPSACAEIAEKIPLHTDACTVFEIRRKPRARLFAALALIFFAAGILCREFRLPRIDGDEPDSAEKHDAGADRAAGNKKHPFSPLMCVFLALFSGMFFVSCTETVKQTVSVLEGTIRWRKQEYQNASAVFLRVLNNCAEEDPSNPAAGYALLGLASCYIMQGEYDAAIARLSQIPQDSPQSVLAAAAYNGGVARYMSGKYQAAADLFKQSLKHDSQNLQAKINLELSLKQIANASKNGMQNLVSVPEQENARMLEQPLFSVIKEEEQNRWKNHLPQTISDDSDIDY
ncbi:MAG: VWA domain-containing protein [Bacteroides sp.]|nr:VWA domain-containing protein [Prevotella sp.]MCM1408528.1 VWA domain-containing protein [Treponema brennaborense]MCM1470758.1 VWA domain-containing protein [Bacteroides sp.]